jgi:hypothetical protein
VAGKKEQPLVRQALRLINATYAPERVVLFREEGEAGTALSELVPWLDGKDSAAAPVTIYICQDFSCRKPLHDLPELKEELQKLSTAGRR